MKKQALRKKYKALRSNLTASQRDQLSLEIANNALELDIWHYENYHIFLPIQKLKEVDTHYLLNVLQGKDKNILVSKSDFDSLKMKHYLLTDNVRLEVNEYGIPEPVKGIELPSTSIDIVFIPLLAYDNAGNRVGYGKGFYDRFLKSCRDNVIKVGLSFFEPENKVTDITTTDTPLNYCISAKKTYSF